MPPADLAHLSITICCHLPLLHLHTECTEKRADAFPFGSLCAGLRTEASTKFKRVLSSPLSISQLNHHHQSVGFVYQAHGGAAAPTHTSDFLRRYYQHTTYPEEVYASRSPPPSCARKQSLRLYSTRTNHPELLPRLSSLRTHHDESPSPALLISLDHRNRTAPRRTLLRTSPRLDLRRPCRRSLCSSDVPI